MSSKLPVAFCFSQYFYRYWVLNFYLFNFSLFNSASSRIFVLCGGPKEKDEGENESNPEVFTTKEDNSELKSDALSKKEDEDTEMLNYRYYEKDPIHWLERYFEREGASMDFRFTKTVEANDLGLGEKSKKSRAKGSKEDDGSSTWICSIELV